MHKDEFDQSAGQKFSKVNVEELCGEVLEEAMGIKEERAQDRCAMKEYVLEVQPVLAQMHNVPC